MKNIFVKIGLAVVAILAIVGAVVVGKKFAAKVEKFKSDIKRREENKDLGTC